MNDEPEQPAENTAKESLDGIVQATQAHADGVIGALNNIAPTTQEHANRIIGHLDGIPPTTQEHANGIIGHLDKIPPATQEHANGIIGALNGITPATQTHANEAIESINGILITVQKHAHGIIGTLDGIIPDTQAHVDNLTKEIKSYHNELLIDGKDDEGNPVNSIKTKMAEYIKEQRGEFNKLHKDLEAEIRSLLPEAGAAGLSSAYFEAKTRYGGVPYKIFTDDETTDGTTLLIPNSVWHFMRANMKGVAFYALFIMPLIATVVLVRYGPIASLFENMTDDNFNPNLWLLRFFVATPFVAISLFGLSTIRLNRRLYEEYNHKQRVMQLYHSFRQEIDDVEQKQILINIMLENVADKPSLAVHSDKEKDRRSNLLERISKIGKSVNPKSEG